MAIRPVFPDPVTFCVHWEIIDNQLDISYNSKQSVVNTPLKCISQGSSIRFMYSGDVSFCNCCGVAIQVPVPTSDMLYKKSKNNKIFT